MALGSTANSIELPAPSDWLMIHRVEVDAGNASAPASHPPPPLPRAVGASAASCPLYLVATISSMIVDAYCRGFEIRESCNGHGSCCIPSLSLRSFVVMLPTFVECISDLMMA